MAIALAYFFLFEEKANFLKGRGFINFSPVFLQCAHSRPQFSFVWMRIKSGAAQMRTTRTQIQGKGETKTARSDFRVKAEEDWQEDTLEYVRYKAFLSLLLSFSIPFPSFPSSTSSFRSSKKWVASKSFFSHHARCWLRKTISARGPSIYFHSQEFLFGFFFPDELISGKKCFKGFCDAGNKSTKCVTRKTKGKRNNCFFFSCMEIVLLARREHYACVLNGSRAFTSPLPCNYEQDHVVRSTLSK